MKYYSEETVRNIMSEVEDVTTSYFWGNRKHYPDIENKEKFNYIEIPDRHNDLIDKAVVVELIGDVYEKLWDKADKDTLSKFHVEILKAILGTPVVFESNDETVE